VRQGVFVGAGVVRTGVGVGRGGVGAGVGVARGVGVAVRVGDGDGVGVGVGLGVAVNDGSGRGVNVTLGWTVGVGEGVASVAPRSGGTSERTAPAAIAPPMATTRRIAIAFPTAVELDRRTITGGGRSIGSVGSLRRSLIDEQGCTARAPGVRSAPPVLPLLL
jgi:hypothetical protein